MCINRGSKLPNYFKKDQWYQKIDAVVVRYGHRLDRIEVYRVGLCARVYLCVFVCMRVCAPVSKVCLLCAYMRLCTEYDFKLHLVMRYWFGNSRLWKNVESSILTPLTVIAVLSALPFPAQSSSTC